MDGTIGSVAREQAPLVAASLTLSFAADPVARYWWREPAAYIHWWPRFAHAMGERGYDHDSVVATPGFEGVAMWLPPGVETDPAQIAALNMPTMPGQDALLAELSDAMDRSHPPEPHWYLWAIGVDPRCQGQRLGGALLRHMLDRVDRHGAIAYLEASSDANARLYARHGFEALDPIIVGDVPPLTPMVRAARAA